jgi:aspartokinase
MSKMRLGGIKAFEKRAYLTSLCRRGENVLEDICSRLAADRINLSLLTYIADAGARESITAACTEGTEGFSSYIHWKASGGECSIGKLLSSVSIVSIFPHDQKLDVTGSLMGVLAGNEIRPYGFASSPSAMTIVLPSSDFERAIYALFDVFEFPTYSSPLDWHAAYRGQEELLHEIVCSYEEEIIKVYNVTYQIDLDLWNIALPHGSLGDFGTALLQLNEKHLRLPFLVSKSSPDADSIYFALCFGATDHEKVKQAFAQKLPNPKLFRLGPVSVFFLHGPHFGDRYGIANALVRALRNAGIHPVAISCAVSSISFVIQGNNADQTLAALNSSFQMPGRQP